MGPRTRTTAGFSLIEIIVVMGIITLIAGITMPVMSKRLTRLRATETRTELALIGPAVMDYFQDTGAFPPTFEDLETNGAGASGWAGPYARALMPSQASSELSLSKDAWNRAYAVRLSGDSALTISSLGADGERGSSDDIELVVDVTPLRRADTRAELAILNSAIASWNATHLPDAPLPDELDDLVEALVDGGYLPAGDRRFEADGWGDAYVVDPEGASPVIGVTSTNVRARVLPVPSDDDRSNAQGNGNGNAFGQDDDGNGNGGDSGDAPGRGR